MTEPLTNKGALDAVRELHRRDGKWCNECGNLWPCATIQAIGGES